MLIAEDNWEANLLDANELNTLLIPVLHARVFVCVPNTTLNDATPPI